LSSLSTHTIVVLVGLLLAFLLAPRFSVSVREFFSRTQHWRASSPSIGLRNPLVFEESDTCPEPEQQVEFTGTFNTRTGRSMTLADQAKRVAAEFNFGKDAVNKAVKEFIREMGRIKGTTGG
jgi:hexokinase